MNDRPVRLLRVTTVPISLKILLRGQLAWMRRQGFEVLAVSADGPEVSDLRAEGIPHVVVPMSRAITPFADLIALFRMYAVIRRFRPDIIHTHTPKAGLIGLLAARLAGVPVRFHTVAGLPLMGLSGWRYRLLILTERFTYQCATEVLVNSFSLRSYIDREITKGKLSLTVLGNGSSNGIDTEYFSRHTEVMTAASRIRRSLSIPEAAPVCCFIGRVVRDKGISELILAFDQVRERHLDLQLLLVGPLEPERDPLTASEAARINAGNGIHSVGYQEDVRPWLAAADVFVFPSYREGFPNVVLQAGAMGLPVIATDINGCNEIVEEGSSGWLVPVRDGKALAAAMEQSLSDPQGLIEKGQLGRKRVVERYDQMEVWRCLEAEYRKAVGAL